MIKRSAAPLPFALVLLLAGCGERKSNESAAAPAGEVLPSRSAHRPPREQGEPDLRVELRDAMDRASRESDPAARETLLEAIAWDALDVDPVLAREPFSALTPGSESSRRLTGHFAMRLAEVEPQRALEWARALEISEVRSEAIGRIAVVLSAADPGQAATLVVEEMPAGLPRDRAVVQILQRWARAAPADAAAWTAAFPQGSARSSGLQTVASAWIEADSAGLASWMESLDDGPVRSEAIFAVARALRPAAAEDRTTRLSPFADATLRRQIESLLSQFPP